MQDREDEKNGLAHAFAEVGNLFLAVGSAVLSASFVFLDRKISEQALLDPSIAYGAAAVIILYVIYAKFVLSSVGSILKESIPTYVFAFAAFIAGVRDYWLYLVFMAAVLTTGYRIWTR